MKDQWLARMVLDRLADAAPSETGDSATPVSLADLCATERAAGYVQATLDMLRSLGAVQADSQSTEVVVTSAMAGFMLRLLNSLPAASGPLVADWHSLGVSKSAGHGLTRAVDLLAAIERRRLELLPNSLPVRHVEAAIGLIGGRNAVGDPALLFHWDQGASMWQLVGGHYEARDGSLRAAMLRELSEELECERLFEGQDLELHEFGPRFDVERLSPTYGLLTRTTFQAFAVRFLTLRTLEHTRTRWICAAELNQQQTTDGQPVSAAPVQQLVLSTGLTLEVLIEAISSEDVS
jgi:8-oxo-dGTP pyrophosphatase MutT (NUDIX family)